MAMQITAAGHTHVLATQRTLDIMAIRYGENHAQYMQAIAFNETIRHNGVDISFAPAEHI